MNTNFPNPKILMTRSPFSVVSSQLNHGGFKNVSKRDWLPDKLCDRFPNIEKLYEKVETVEEVLGWNWCVDTLLGLQDRDHSSVFLVTYEELILDPLRVTNALAVFLNLEDVSPKTLAAQVRTPSSTASNGVYSDDPAKQITRYKDRLSLKQIQRIERLIEKFGLEFYLNDALRASDISICKNAEIFN